MFSSCGVYRVGRHRLFNQLISDIRFDKQLDSRVPDPTLNVIIDRFLDRVCSTAVMVVQANRPDGDHYSLWGTSAPMSHGPHKSIATIWCKRG